MKLILILLSFVLTIFILVEGSPQNKKSGRHGRLGNGEKSKNMKNRTRRLLERDRLRGLDGLARRDRDEDVVRMVKTDKSTCGYEACDLGKADMLNVHLVPHTHDDVGWLKTIDQYYYGAKNNIQHAGVQYILDTVIDQLQKDPRKRFIYVEIAFFYRWWQEQHDSFRHFVKGLVNQGRLEFILGGWCMNDEASTHYNAIIDQHTVGFRFLQRNFGDCGRPKIGWQIDPFGHSREQASIFAQFGFDGLFFGRLDYQDKEKRLKDKTMEHMWLGSRNLGGAASLFTGVNYNGYGPPNGFCFDRGCSDPPIMDNPALEDYNVEDKVKEFISAAKDQASHFTTNHIMMTMGSDFQFENALQNYKNIDKLIKYVNQKQSNGSEINLLYSTPSCYLYALNKANQTYTAKTDDFFPYASRAHTFWTGYFTSRPALKYYVRNTNNFLQVCKQLDVLSNLGPEYGSALKLDILRRAMGVAQHHDAVSGTEKQPVADDYARRLSEGVRACQDVVNYAYTKLVPLPGTSTGHDQVFCPFINASSCSVTENNDQLSVLLYNPIGREVEYWARIPIRGTQYDVMDSDLSHVQSQVVPLTAETKNLPEHKGSKANATLIFKALLPPLGFTTYFVSKTSFADRKLLPIHVVSDEADERLIGFTKNFKCNIPAASVKWFKDGQPITQQRNYNLNFNKILKVRVHGPEDSGRYHCEAEKRGKLWRQYWSIRVNLEGTPSRPYHLKAELMGPSFLHLSWKVNSSKDRQNMVAYSVHYGIDGEAELQQVTSDTQLVLADLQPGGDYEIYVVAYSASRISRPSTVLKLHIPGPDDMLRGRNSPPSKRDDTVIQNQHMKLSFSSSTGLLTTVTLNGNPNPIHLNQQLMYYQSYKGNNSEPEFQASGAYVFRPNGSRPLPITENKVAVKVTEGDLVQEVHQVFNEWASQTVRLYKDAKYAEFEWTVGPIPVSDGIGKEIISEFTSDLSSNGVFYTDSNGREILPRVRDYRPTWKLNQTEPVAGNYYPVNSRIFIQDVAQNMQLTVLTDRSQGGASVHDGQIELMVHRRMLVDDAFGVGEALNETGIDGKGLVVRGRHYMLLSSISEAASLHRDMAEKLFMAPSISFLPLDVTPLKYKTMYRTKWSGVSSALPANVHLLTLEEWEANSFLLRLEHFYEKDEDPILSKPATVQLKDLFSTLNVTSVNELTLGANQALSDAQRLQWNVKDLGRTNGNMASFVTPVDPVTLEVTLKPMQIRTFQVFFQL